MRFAAYATNVLLKTAKLITEQSKKFSCEHRFAKRLIRGISGNTILTLFVPIWDSSATTFRLWDVSAMVVANVSYEKSVFLKYFKG